MIKLIKSTFYNEKKTKKELAKFLINAKQLSFGSECAKFESNFAKFQGRRHCVFVNSGSSANLALVQALLNLGKVERGDKIGFSALTWSTNAMPIIQLGLEAVPIDVELDTLNVSSEKLLHKLSIHNLKVLFITNLLGFCDDIDKIRTICKEKKIVLIEDNCESLGSVYKGKRLGNFGLASTFSFYVGHHMSTIEGGAICTDDEKLATMLRIVRAHGWDRNLNFVKQEEIRRKFKVNSTFYSRYTFYDLGYNFRPTEVNGFLGNKQLRYLKKIIAKRQATFKKIAKKLYVNNDKYYEVKFNHLDIISNFAIPLVCRSRTIRDSLVKKCEGKVEIRPIVGGDITEQPFFRKHMKGFLGDNPNAKLVHEQGLYFGNNPELTEKDIKKLIKIFDN